MIVTYYQNFFDYEQGNFGPIVQGRRRANIKFWKSIGASDFIMDTIQQDYKILFKSTPVPAKFQNNTCR